MLNIRSIELVEINLPLVHFFETSFGRTYERRIILVRVEDTDGAEGWGEITCGETPGYSDEWTDSAWVTAEKILAPMVVGREVDTAANVWDLMKWARGHRMSRSGIETACWDLEAKKTRCSALAAFGRRQPGDRMRRFDRHSGQRGAAFGEN